MSPSLQRGGIFSQRLFSRVTFCAACVTRDCSPFIYADRRHTEALENSEKNRQQQLFSELISFAFDSLPNGIVCRRRVFAYCVGGGAAAPTWKREPFLGRGRSTVRVEAAERGEPQIEQKGQGETGVNSNEPNLAEGERGRAALELQNRRSCRGESSSTSLS